MTTTDTANKFRYEGNGVTDTFAFSGRVFAATDIAVEIITRATDELEETLTINTHYTVTINTDGTASVEVTSAPKIPSVTQDILLRRVLPQTQSLSLPTGTPFPAKNVETALDRVTALVQDLDEQIGRSLKLPAQTSASTAFTVEPEDDAILAWDGVTGQLKNGPTTASFTEATNTAVTAAATATTQAGIATTQAGISTTQASASAASAILAESWAIDPIGDRPEGSAKYWSEQAEAFAESVNLPALGAAHTVLQVNTAGAALEYALLDVNNLKAGFISEATSASVATGDSILFSDANDSNATKRDTVANLLALQDKTEFGSWLFPTLQNQDYKLIIKAPYGGTITNVITQSVSGTCTMTVKINTTALGGTANSVSSSESDQAHSTNNVFAAGDDIVVTVTSNSSCLRTSLTIVWTRA